MDAATPRQGDTDMKRTSLSAAIVLCGVLTLLVGCGEKAPGPVVMDEAAQEAWEIRLVEMRIDKNEEFLSKETKIARAKTTTDTVTLEDTYT